MKRARATESFAPTRWKRTSPAPTAASVRMKKTDAPAARRAGWPFGWSRKTHRPSAKTSSSAMPLVARWVNSIIVSRAGARGTTSPLQRGQWAPQPAPEPVARTKAPHRMTATFQPRTSPGEPGELRHRRAPRGDDPPRSTSPSRPRPRAQPRTSLPDVQVVVPGQLQDQGADDHDSPRDHQSVELADHEADRDQDQARLPGDADDDVEHVAPEVPVGLEARVLLSHLGQDRAPEAPRPDLAIEGLEHLLVLGRCEQGSREAAERARWPGSGGTRSGRRGPSGSRPGPPRAATRLRCRSPFPRSSRSR